MPYEGSVLSTQLKVSGVEVFSAGDFMENEEKKAIKVFDEQQGIYKKLVFEQNDCRSRSFWRKQRRTTFILVQKQKM